MYTLRTMTQRREYFLGWLRYAPFISQYASASVYALKIAYIAERGLLLRLCRTKLTIGLQKSKYAIQIHCIPLTLTAKGHLRALRFEYSGSTRNLSDLYIMKRME